MDSEIKSAIFKELENREILPVIGLRNAGKDIETNKLLDVHLSTDSDDIDKSLAALTGNINKRREAMRKAPVSGEMVQEAINAGIEKVLGAGKQTGKENLTDIADRLGFKIPPVSTGIGIAA